MKHWLRDNVRWVAPIAAIAAVFAGWLIFGYFGFQTLLFDDEVNEDVPVFASGAAPSGIPSDEVVADDAAAINQAMQDEATPSDAPSRLSPPIPSPMGSSKASTGTRWTTWPAARAAHPSGPRSSR